MDPSIDRDPTADPGREEPPPPPGAEPARTPEPGPPPLDPAARFWESPAPPAEPGATGWQGVGAIVSRTLDTHGTLLPLFVGLGLPGALLGSMFLFVGANMAAILVIGLVSAAVGLITGAAMMFATDDLWRGVRPSFGDVLDRAAGRAVALLASSLVVFLVLGVLIFIIAFVFVALSVVGVSGSRSTANLAIGALVAIAIAGIAAIIGLRWALAGAAITLGGLGPLAGLNRSRALTSGQVLRFIGLYLALGLIVALAIVGANLLATYASQRALAAVGLVVASVLVGPVSAIAMAITYRDLTGWPPSLEIAASGAGVDEVGEPGPIAAEPGPVAAEPQPSATGAALADVAGVEGAHDVTRAGPPHGSGRPASLLAVLGGGLIIAAAGIWTAVDAGGQAYVPGRGQVVAGTATSLTDPCHPTGVKASFGSSEAIWIAAVFSEHVLAGDEIVVEYYRGGELLGTQPLVAGPIGLDCYYEVDPLTGAPSGSYRIVVRYDSKVIADGTFTVR